MILTLVLISLMQIKVSGVSIETRAEAFIRSSTVTTYLQQAADGGASFARDAYNRVKHSVLDSTSMFIGSELDRNDNR